MRILFLSSAFPVPWAPDHGSYNLRLCQALLGKHDVRVVAPVPWLAELEATLRGKPGVPKDRCTSLEGIDVDYPRYWYPPGILRSAYHRFLWNSTRKHLEIIAKEFAPQAVLGYWAHPDGQVAVQLARRIGASAWIMVGGSDVFLLTRDGTRRRRILQALRSADGVIAVCEELRNRLVDLGLPDSDVHVVRRGVDRAHFQPGDRGRARARLGMSLDERALLWVGRFAEIKGLETLIKALALLRPGPFKTMLYLAGGGPLDHSIRARVRQAGLHDSVRFLGRVPHADLVHWYQAVDLTVLPSLSEGIPNVLLESHACGTPFVASAVGGVPEIALNGIDELVGPGDAAELAQAIEGVLGRGQPTSAALAASVPAAQDSAGAVAALLAR